MRGRRFTRCAPNNVRNPVSNGNNLVKLHPHANDSFIQLTLVPQGLQFRFVWVFKLKSERKKGDPQIHTAAFGS